MGYICVLNHDPWVSGMGKAVELKLIRKYGCWAIELKFIHTKNIFTVLINLFYVLTRSYCSAASKIDNNQMENFMK